MFFLLKCACWLAIVYAAMTYGIGPLGRLSSEGAPRPTEIVSRVIRPDLVATAATGEVVSYCTRHASECLADAARLTALAQAVAGETPAYPRVTRPAADGAPALVATAVVPMPVPDPRRQGRVSRLTERP